MEAIQPEGKPALSPKQQEHLKQLFLKMTNAEQWAKRFKEKTIFYKDGFTIIDLIKLSGLCQQDTVDKFNELVIYAFIKVVGEVMVGKDKGQMIFKIVFKPEDRIELLDIQLQEQDRRMVEITLIREMILAEQEAKKIPPAPPSPTVTESNVSTTE